MSIYSTVIPSRLRLAKASAVFIFYICVSHGIAYQAIPADMHSWAMANIEDIYNEKFKQAEDEAKNIIKKYPEHPAGYFFLAVAIDAWMEYYQSNNREEDFYRCCDKAIENGERLLDKEPDNAWVKFFYGGADGYKGTYETRYGKLITASRHGWKGVSSLIEIEKSDPDIHDVNFGIGTYNYWRSAMTKMLWWMPGVGDKSKEGIKQLYDAKNFGIYTKTSASKNLVPILINEKQYGQALDICDEMLERYPTTLIFYWGKAEALFGLERYGQSEQQYHYILSRVEAEQIDNHYNAVLCHFRLAGIYLQMKQYTQVIAECNRMSNYKLSDEIKKRLEKYFGEANTLKNKAKSAMLEKQEGEFKP
jgi:tetratricopeptide (TPR) repeat protein